LEASAEVEVETPYGKVGATTGRLDGRKVVFLARHGRHHSVPPHRVNYRANIWALKELGVERVLTTAAVGSLNSDFRPGEFVLPNQFLDFTKARPATFYENEVVHTDFTQPYCPVLRYALEGAAGELGLTVHNGGCYVGTEGPRFETPAEIAAYRRLGGDLVGMTGLPEVVLARELGLCYATVAIVTNFAAGISGTMLSHQEVLDLMATRLGKVLEMLLKTIRTLPREKHCRC
jgi:5'-methylthioadenosine phosphorylase